MSAELQKPKVVHIINSFHQGGAELGLLNLIKRGFYKDVDLHVVGLFDSGDDSIQDKFAQELGSGRVISLTNVRRTPGRIDASPLGIYTVLRGLQRAFDEINPDTAVLSLSYSVFLGQLAAMFRPGLKVVSFEHDTKHTPLIAFAHRLVSRRSDAVFVDSSATLRARGKYYKGKPAYEVPLTILEPATPRMRRVPNRFKILSVGRLAEQKNYGALIRAVKILADENRELELTLAGEGPLQQKLKSLAAELGIADRIHFTGLVSDQDELRKLRHGSDIYVQPSRHEGFCLAAAEALAAGMPVVASDIGGMRDYGHHGVNMLKIKQASRKGANPEEIAASLRKMMDEYGHRAAPMSAAAVDTAQRLFSEEPVRAKWATAQAALMNARAT